MSVRGIARSGNCPWGNCLLGKFPSGKCLRGTIRRGNVLQGNVRRGTALELTKRSKHFNCYICDLLSLFTDVLFTVIILVILLLL